MLFRSDAGVGVISSGFGARDGRVHAGIDIAAPLGTAIHAAAGGQVLYAGDGMHGYGNVILVQHGDGFLTVYAHNEENLVRAGDRVEKGQIIGRVGETGNASGPHLHFELRFADAPVSPLHYVETR